MSRTGRIAGAIALLAAPFSACGTAESQVGEEAQVDSVAEGVNVPFSTREWTTDFSRHSVPLNEIVSGGPPKDGIPAIDDPRFVSVKSADRWIDDPEPIIVFEHRGTVQGYPWQILIWHEVVNDEVHGRPVAITYCPLCNTAIAFDRRVGDRVLDFGTTGKLRHSDLVMYDRQTESWWQQATGEAIVGALTGTRLTFLAAPTVAWQDFKAEHPEARVLSRDTGYRRDYGKSPYAGYDTGRPFLFRGKPDGRLPAMARVVIVQSGATAVAYPMETLQQERVINHRVGNTPVAVFQRPGAASAVDARRIAGGRDVGAAVAFRRSLEGRTLTFRAVDDRFVDLETGSSWTFFGVAVEGPLAGSRLDEVVHFTPFWFAWAAFRPATPIYGR